MTNELDRLMTITDLSEMLAGRLRLKSRSRPQRGEI